MRTVKELKEFARRYFPQGSVVDDGFEIIINTGLASDRATGQLVDLDDDGSGLDDDEELEFGRYRGD